MTRYRPGSLGLLFSLVASCASAPPPAPLPQHAPVAVVAPPPPVAPVPPVAKRGDHLETLHGIARQDEYYWLRNKDTPEVLDYLNAENAYTEASTKASEPLQKALYDEMLARIKQTDLSVPSRHDGYFSYARTVEGQQYAIYCRKSVKGATADDRTGATATAPEEVMLDLNEMGKGQKFIELGAIEMSDDARHLAYTVDLTGFRQYTLHIKDLTTGVVATESVPRVDSIAWAADGKSIFYVVEEEIAKRPFRLYRHVLGTDVAKDALVYEEKDERFNLGVERTRSRAYILVAAASHTTSEVRYLRADHPEEALRLIEPRVQDREYEVDHRGDSFYIVTNYPVVEGGPKARNNRLVAAPVKSPGRAHWKELIAHREDVMLERIDLFNDWMVVSERADALPRLRVIPLGKEGSPVDIQLPEALHAVFPDANREFKTNWFRFHYESLITPDSVFDYDLHTHQLTLLKREEVLGGYDPANYVTERVHATASDGTQIPISIVRKKDLPAGAPHPMLLYAYGSYGISIPLTFDSNRVSLLDRGVVYGLAHIRGGGDLGKRWHDEGRMISKMNTFTDFMACAEELIKSGVTSSDRLVIEGGSAGGLLMGAVTNLRPDLWKAVVAEVPFVDVINSMLDETLPETVSEFEEWGNPKKKPEYDAMIAYSPYDNIAKKAYPSILVMTSYNDSQVMYWEPAKYVARLRAQKTDSNPLYLKINMEPAGHGGQSGRYDQLHQDAFVMAFMLGQLGIGK